MRRLRGALVALPIGVATALLILGVAVAMLLNPIWVSMGQERAESGLLTGYGPAELRGTTDAILGDLILGPPDFDVAINGTPVLTERERGHMRDVRNVFVALYAAVAVAGIVLIVAALASRRSGTFWRSVRRGARGLAIVVLVAGFVGLLFFDAAFEAFHQVFFPAGSYTFDPGTDRLVQLFPNQFWVDTSIVLGALLVILGFAVSSMAGTRAKRIDAARAVASDSTAAVAPRDTNATPEPVVDEPAAADPVVTDRPATTVEPGPSPGTPA